MPLAPPIFDGWYMFIQPINMVMTGGWFIIAISKLNSNFSPILKGQKQVCFPKFHPYIYGNFHKYPTSSLGIGNKTSEQQAIGAEYPIKNSRTDAQTSQMKWGLWMRYPRCSMYGILTYIDPKNGPNVGKYSMHGTIAGIIAWIRAYSIDLLSNFANGGLWLDFGTPRVYPNMKHRVQ